MKKRVSLLIETLRLPAFETRTDELVFWQRHDTRRLGFRKFFLMSGLVIMSALAVLDVMTGGEQASQLLIIRAGTVALLAITFYFFCRPQTPVKREVLISLFGIIAIVSLSVMTLVGPITVAETYPFIVSATVIYGRGCVKSLLLRSRRRIRSEDGRLICLLYTSPSPRDRQKSRMPSSA